MLTHNRKDFVHLHGRDPNHCGIVAVSRDPDAVAAARRVDAAIARIGNLDRQLIRVNRLPN